MTSSCACAEARRARPLLGTLVEISARAALPAAALHAAINQAYAAVERVHRLMSFQDPDSDLSALNRGAQFAPVTVDAATFEVLRQACDIARQSGGAFDPAIGARLVRSGHLPGPAPQTGGGWQDIELLEAARQVRFHRPLLIDLGGIAKGYAVDRAIASLRAAGVEQALVNAGGDLRSLGRHRIGLRDPAAPARLAQPLWLEDAALATSGAYFSRRATAAGERSALVHPATGACLLDEVSVSIIAPDCMTADALTKVALFAPPARARRMMLRHRARPVWLGTPGMRRAC